MARISLLTEGATEEEVRRGVEAAELVFRRGTATPAEAREAWHKRNAHEILTRGEWELAERWEEAPVAVAEAVSNGQAMPYDAIDIEILE